MATWQDRWRDAQGFWELAEAGYEPKSRYGNPVASNAIMALIAANDAICLRLGHRQPKGESHTEASDFLKDACRGTQWEQDAAEKARQLLEVLRQKNVAQYLGKPLSPGKVSRIMKQVERFLEWTEGVLPAGRAAGRNGAKALDAAAPATLPTRPTSRASSRKKP